VPATSTLAGDYYKITSAGTSQSKTWALGDQAIYNGTSGSWTQIAGYYLGVNTIGSYTASIVYTANVASRSGLTANDGVTPVAGDVILLTAQTTASQNGPWVAASGSWTRPTWWPAAGTTQAINGAVIFVTAGTLGGGTSWSVTTTGTITIDTTSVSFAKVANVLATASVQGEVQIATQVEQFAAISTSKALTADALFFLAMRKRSLIWDWAATTFVNGSLSYPESDMASAQTSATANSSFSLRLAGFTTIENTSQAGGGSGTGVDWLRPLLISFSFAPTGRQANSIFRAQTKSKYTTALGRISSQGIGLEIVFNRIWIIAHDGTTLTAFDTGVDMNNGSYRWTLHSDGAGTVRLYRGYTLIGSTSGGPTTISNNGDNCLTVEGTNGATATNLDCYGSREVVICGG